MCLFTSRVNDRSIFTIVAVFILHSVLHKLYVDAIASHKVHTLLDLNIFWEFDIFSWILLTVPFTVWPKSLYPLHIVTYYIKSVKTSWTYSIIAVKFVDTALPTSCAILCLHWFCWVRYRNMSFADLEPSPKNRIKCLFFTWILKMIA